MPNFSLDNTRFSLFDNNQYSNSISQEIHSFLKNKIIFIGLEGILLVFDNKNKKFENQMKIEIVNGNENIFKNFG